MHQNNHRPWPEIHKGIKMKKPVQQTNSPWQRRFSCWQIGATAAFLLGLLAVPGASRVQAADGAPAFSFTSIEVPDARGTTAWGINPKGDIVGNYNDAGRTRGFLLREGKLTTIDFPGSGFTSLRGISPGGDIVGNYRLAGEPGIVSRGFLLTRHGDFIPVSYPGRLHVILQRILPNGTILGCNHDLDMVGSMHGIIISRKGFEEWEIANSMHNGATPDGKTVVGHFHSMETGRRHGHLLTGGQLEILDPPGSVFTQAWDINPGQQVVGEYRDPVTGIHGFLFAGGTYYQLDFPGATATRLLGINSGGDIVGNYVDATGRFRGFVAKPAR